jgi:hypothetical protein
VKLGVALALVAAALVVVVEGCRGSGDSRLAYPEFQRRATVICLRYRTDLAKLGAPTTMPRIATVAKGAQRLGAVEQKALRRLDAPEDADASFTRMLDRFGKADALLPQLRRAAAKRDAGTAQALAGQGRVLVAAGNKAAAALGLLDCRRA